MESKRLKAVGYWRSWQDHRFPRPQWLVQENWRRSEREGILRYLQEGRLYNAYGGYSFCRFHCGVPQSQMGSYDQTDGCWIWPQGLAHYVEHHSIFLPDEFVEAMRVNDWKVPNDITITDRILTDESYRFWLSWVKCCQLRPWNYRWVGREFDRPQRTQ
jgi:hypothetical protein